LTDDARIVMVPTRATPIISAAAVAEVRLGLRMAFSRASVPDTPLRRGRGAPIMRLIGAARIGPRTATPTNTSMDPRPTRAMPAEPNSPAAMAAAPSPVTANPTTARFRLLPEVSRATSRIAAMGGTFAARRAGNTADATLTPRPATRETMTVLQLTTMLPVGKSIPMPEKSALRPVATPMPPRSPSPEAMSPTTTASMSTEPST
jgi:hypothetical protein